MKNAAFYINELALLPHPEGGYFKEIYRDKVSYPKLPEFNDSRNYSTAIYYLLEQGNYSSFHRIKSDEVWHHYDGGCVLVHYFENNQLITKKLGKNLEEGEQPMLVVPKKTWFAAQPAPDSEFALMGCTVAPGFDFKDFELANASDLQNLFPEHQELINRLSK